MNEYKFSYRLEGDHFQIVNQPEAMRGQHTIWTDPETEVPVYSAALPEVRPNIIYIRGERRGLDHTSVHIQMELPKFEAIIRRFQIWVEENY